VTFALRSEEVLAGARNLMAFVLVERAALAELRGDSQQQETDLRRASEELTRMGVRARALQFAPRLD
jgi:hypothetical protein